MDLEGSRNGKKSGLDREELRAYEDLRLKPYQISEIKDLPTRLDRMVYLLVREVRISNSHEKTIDWIVADATNTNLLLIEPDSKED